MNGPRSLRLFLIPSMSQLGVAMAERAGVRPDVLRALQEEDADAMPADVALVWGFTRATLAHDPAADQYRQAIVERWGPRALVSLAFAMVVARSYPTVKYAMGHGQACTRVVVGGAPVALGRGAAHARDGASARCTPMVDAFELGRAARAS